MSWLPLGQREHFLYRVYDADGCLLYIGATSDLETRFKKHHNRVPSALAHLPIRELRDRMAFWFAQSYPDRASAMAAETAACLAERPELNTRKVEAA